MQAILTNIHMRLAPLEHSSIGSGGESVVAEDFVNGINSSTWGNNVPRGAQERGDGAGKSHCDAGRRRINDSK